MPIHIQVIKGSELKLLLKRKKIFQADLVRDLGYNQTTVSRYFTGDLLIPSNDKSTGLIR